LEQGGFKAFAFDVKCFWGTIFSVAKGEGVVEGGTGEMKKKENENE
jgi:O-antigen biosynthesis protein WbqP